MACCADPVYEGCATPEVVSGGPKRQPPTLCAPDAKHVPPSHDHKHNPLKQPCVFDESSPVPPEFATPGLRKLRKGGGEEMAELALPVERDLLRVGDDVSTPEPPELTTSLQVPPSFCCVATLMSCGCNVDPGVNDGIFIYAYMPPLPW